jgi:hypothetical protein
MRAAQARRVRVHLRGREAGCQHPDESPGILRGSPHPNPPPQGGRELIAFDA